MNIKKGFSIAVVFIFFILFLSAQNKVEKSIANRIEILRQAMVNADKEALNDLVCEKLSYGHSAGYVENKNEFINNLASGKNDFVKIELSNQSISISGNVAIVRHRMDASTQDAGKPPAQIKLLILMVWQKDHGNWKLLARQAVKILV